jgi:hypothetical protein
LELEKCNDGDIIFYRDCNCTKYPQYLKFHKLQSTIEDILSTVKFDFVISQENESLKIVHHCKARVINDLAINAEFTKEFPLLIANQIIARKSQTSMALVDEWLYHCKNKELINGDGFGKEDDRFRWHTAEQAVLSVIISNWVYERKFNIPRNYPNIIYPNRNMYDYYSPN